MKDCKTKYPILLLHGLNCKDNNSFGRIPEILNNCGAKVYLGGQDSCGTIEMNAIQIKKKIKKILKYENCLKINIIAHSKGGLEARYVASKLHMGSKIASITTISTPHYGSKTAGKLSQHVFLLNTLGLFLNFYWKLLGDKYPDFAHAIKELSLEYMIKFNSEVCNIKNIFYQSYGVSLNSAKDDIQMALCRLCVYFLDGENDWLVSPKSAEWGLYRGVIKKVSHQDIVDFRKKDLKHFNIIDFYINIVHNLLLHGF